MVNATKLLDVSVDVNCSTCVVTPGFIVFPASQVPVGDSVEACARVLITGSSSCNVIFNSIQSKIETVNPS